MAKRKTLTDNECSFNPERKTIYFPPDTVDRFSLRDNFSSCMIYLNVKDGKFTIKQYKEEGSILLNKKNNGLFIANKTTKLLCKNRKVSFFDTSVFTLKNEGETIVATIKEII